MNLNGYPTDGVPAPRVYEEIVAERDRYVALLTERDALATEVERLHVQLAGCLVVAEGGTSEPVLAHKGDYGWSPAYAAVLKLRLAYEDLAKDG